MTITMIVILMFTAAYWLLKPRSDQKRDHKRKPKIVRSVSSTRSPYLATSISFKRCGCTAVKAIGKTRFLTSATVPKLPLAECSAATCGCRFIRHQDRRSTQGDRRAIYSLQTDLYTHGQESERRMKKGRRESDWSGNAASDLNYADFDWTT